MSLPQRQCLILQGEHDWLYEQAQRVYSQTDSVPSCWLSDSVERPEYAISSKQALQLLGRENQLIIFDAQARFSADAFGSLIGTLQAGGSLVLLLPDSPPSSLWLKRFLLQAEASSAVQFIKQGDNAVISLAEPALPSLVGPTQEQTDAIQAVLHVVSGHRRRPLVIDADRGRGKSALLGMAAAELLKQGKKQILVTAPAIRNCETLFKHAKAALPDAQQSQFAIDWQRSTIRFVASDALLAERPAADLLIIDEAAALPAQLLEQMLIAYSRVVFATTLHGYEGTGRGFAVRFRATLDRLTPNWRSLTLKQPVRWAADDVLERFSFDALLLNAEPCAEEALSDVTPDKIQFEVLSREAMATDETELREMFGLMVLAHYRTRPSDLQMLLDNDDVSVAVLRYQGHVIASAWLLDEPAIEDELAQKIFDGQRRLRGQLLPQSLLSHAGLSQAGRYHYQRIIRIAVHPSLQRQGYGQLLLAKLWQQAQGHYDLLGASFAMETAVNRFWLNSGYAPLRLGQHRDEVTGSVAVMMFRAVSPAGEKMLVHGQQQFMQAWPFLLLTQLKPLPAELVLSLTAGRIKPSLACEPDLLEQVFSFAHQQRSMESSQHALWRWLHSAVADSSMCQLIEIQQHLLVMLILQQREMAEVCSLLNLSGRAEAITLLRQAVSECLAASSLETR
jgi:tRNA(Met) cytidine acetyltransferase